MSDDMLQKNYSFPSHHHRRGIEETKEEKQEEEYATVAVVAAVEGSIIFDDFGVRLIVRYAGVIN